MFDTPSDVSVTEMAAEIVSAYVRNNSVPAGELPALLRSVHEALNSVVNGPAPEPAKEPPQPKVSVKRSVTHDYIVCLEDGKRYKSLKRHLQSAYGLTPQEYRDKWGLPKDYPMVAPAYANARSDLAKSMGLGRKAAAAAAPKPEGSEPEPAAPAEPELDLAAEIAAPAEAEAAQPGEPSPEPAGKARRRRAA